MERAKGQIQRWQPLLPNLRRVNEAAIAPPPVQEPAAVTPHGGFRGGKSQQWLRYPISATSGSVRGRVATSPPTWHSTVAARPDGGRKRIHRQVGRGHRRMPACRPRRRSSAAPGTAARVPALAGRSRAGRRPSACRPGITRRRAPDNADEDGGEGSGPRYGARRQSQFRRQDGPDRLRSWSEPRLPP